MSLPGIRIRDNAIFGVTIDNPLTIGALVFNSTGLSGLSVVAGDHAIVTLDPLKQYGEPEIVAITTHTAAATFATITRGLYGTVARAHPQGTTWVHAPVEEDYTEIVTSITRPGNPYRGQKLFETDTNRYVGRTVTDTWQQEGLFFDPPCCRVYHNVNQSFNNGTEQTVAFNSERFDTDTMHDNVTNNSRITFNTAGIYLLTATIEFDLATDYTYRAAFLRRNGSELIDEAISQNSAATNLIIVSLKLSTTWKFNAGDYVEIRAQQNSTAARNIVAAPSRAPEFTATWIGRGN